MNVESKKLNAKRGIFKIKLNSSWSGWYRTKLDFKKGILKIKLSIFLSGWYRTKWQIMYKL